MLKVTQELSLGKWQAVPKLQIELHTAFCESSLCDLSACTPASHTQTCARED